MKRWLIFLLGSLSLAFSQLSAQVVSPASPSDTHYKVPVAVDSLPAITMKFEPGYLLVYLVVPAGSLFIGGHSYQINGEKLSNPARLKPYFVATGNETLLKYYQIHKDNRRIWYAATSAGTVLWLVGFVQAINSLFDSSAGGGAGIMILLGSAGIMGGQVARVISFQKLRKGVNYYNFAYAGKSHGVSMHLGLPSTYPAGIGLYVKF
jgi:hypothetical protein